MSGPGDEKRFFVADTRRRFSLEEKLTIVAETATLPVTRVARKHGISCGLVFRWRKMLGKRASAVKTAEHGFVPIALPAPAMRQETNDGRAHEGVIEIVLSGGRRVLVGKDVDTAALKRVIDALDSR